MGFSKKTFIGVIILFFSINVKGQNEDILCHPCVREYHLLHPSEDIRFSNDCPDQVQFVGFFGDFSTVYLNVFDCEGPNNNSCDPNSTFVIFNPNFDTYPNCSTNHTNFTTYSGSLQDFTIPTNCQDYPLKEEYNLGDQIRLYTHIRTNEDPLTHDKLIRITYQDGTILQNFYSYNGFQLDGSPIPSPINTAPFSCSRLSWSYTPPKAGFYYVEYIIFYTDGTPYTYDDSQFEVKSNGPTIPTFTDVTPPSWNSIDGGCDAQVGDIDNNGFMDIVFNYFDVLNMDGVFSQSGVFLTERDGSLIDTDKDGILNYLNDLYYHSDFDNTSENILLKGKRTSSNCFSNTFVCTFYNPIDEACSPSYFDQLTGFNGNENEKLSTLPIDWNNDKSSELIIWDTIYNIDDYIPLSKSKLPIQLFEHCSADMDNDGKIDLVNSPIGDDPLQILLNNLSLTTLNRNTWGQIYTADVNNDGEMDILNEGVYFKHKGELKFEFFKDLPNLPIEVGRIVKPIDYDKDGDIDLFFPHKDGLYAKLYRNNSTIKNLKPNRPQNPVAIVLGNRVDFSWSNGGDDLTKFPTYNLFVQNKSTGKVVYFPHSDTTTTSGQLRLLEKGNCEYNTGWFLKDLAPGRYRWKVQAVDQGYMGSEWAVGQDFVISEPVCDTEVEMVQGVSCIMPKNLSTGQLLLVCNNLSGMLFDNNLGKRYKIGYSQHNGCINNCLEGTPVQIYCIEPLEDITCNSPDELVLAAPSIEAAQGSDVCIPVMVRHFRNMQSGQGDIKWDQTLLQYTEVKTPTSGGIPGFSGGFNATNAVNGEFKYLWANDTPALPLTLPDNTVIMELCFKVTGDTGKAAYVVFGQGTLATDWQNDNGPVPVCFEYGKVSVTQKVCTFSGLQVKHTTCGQKNGSVTLQDIGCTYLWPDGITAHTRTGLDSGSYSITLLPSGKDTTVIINGSSPLILGVPFITQPSCNMNNGGIELDGGLASTYRWEDGPSDRIRTNLSPGTYSYTVTDIRNCTATGDVILNQSSSLNANTEIKRQPTCQDGDGEVILMPNSQDTLEYKFNWSDLSISGYNPKNLQADKEYKVTVTRSVDNCTSTVIIPPISKFSPGVNINSARTWIDCKDPSPIQLILNIDNKDDYNNIYPISSYTWSNAEQISSITVKPTQSTTYRVTIMDSKGCTATANREIKVDQQKPNIGINTPDGSVITCYKPSLLLVTQVIAGSPSSEYTYLWNNANSGISFMGDQANTYSVIATSIVNGCKDTASVAISDNRIAPKFDLIYRGKLTCKHSIDTLDIGIDNRTLYTYKWDNQSSSMPRYIDQINEYVLTVTNIENGCTARGVFNIEEDKDLPDFNLIIDPEKVTCKKNVGISIELDTSNYSLKAFKYLWHNGSIADFIIVGDTSSIEVLVTNLFNGCEANQKIFIEVDQDSIPGAPCGDEPGFYIQDDCTCEKGCKTLTLSDDDQLINVGRNSYLKIELANAFETNVLTIVNRWGQKVFEKKGYISDWQNGWRGQLFDTGDFVPDGAYYFSIDLLPEQKGCRFAGSVTVVR